MFPDEATAHGFLDAVESMLREGAVAEADRELASAVAALIAAGHPVGGLCDDATLGSITISGWSLLEERCARIDRAGAPVTAVGIDLSCHGDERPDEQGRIEPYLETSFYSDNPFAFSTSDRATLLAALADPSESWKGCFAEIDGTIEVHGLGGLNHALIDLHERCRAQAGNQADPLDHDALLIGEAFQALRIHQAVRAEIERSGLPRALAIIVGSNESRPFFEAPVITAPECRDAAIGADSTGPEDEAAADVFDDNREGEKTLSGPALRRQLHGDAPASPAEQIAPPAASRGLLGRLFKMRRAA